MVRTWQGQTWNPGLRPSHRAQKSPFALSYCVPTVPYHYSSTTDNLILNTLKGAQPWPNWGTGHEPPSSLNLALHVWELLYWAPLYHSSAGQGHTRWALIRAGFHRMNWEVPSQLLNWFPPAAPQRPFFTHFQHTSKQEERAQRNIQHTTQSSQRQLRHDLFYISALPLLDLFNTSALPPNQWRPAGFEPPAEKKSFSRLKKNFAGPTILIISVCVLFIHLHIYKNGRWWRLGTSRL